jgi:hypothetical protein
LRAGPWTVSHFHRSTLGLHKTPWKFRGACNVVLRLRGSAAGRNSARPAAGPTGKRGEARSRDCREPV